VLADWGGGYTVEPKGDCREIRSHPARRKTKGNHGTGLVKLIFPSRSLGSATAAYVITFF
jgi:hypothetical protein